MERKSNDPFDFNELIQREIVAHVHFEKEMPSTNDWALENCRIDTHSYPLLVITHNQTAGRGRNSKHWLSNQKSLTFSIVVDLETLNLETKDRPLISLAVAVAIESTVNDFATGNSAIKWPNDVMLDDKKVSGILVESIGSELAVVGIGINVGQSVDLPEAISISESGGTANLQEILVSVLNNLRKTLEVVDTQPTAIIEICRKKFWLQSKMVEIQVGNEITTGKVAGISDSGGIQIQTPAEEKTFFSGQVNVV